MEKKRSQGGKSEQQLEQIKKAKRELGDNLSVEEGTRENQGGKRELRRWTGGTGKEKEGGGLESKGTKRGGVSV